MPVAALFRDDFYLKTAEATVTAVHEDGGIELDQTCFYATSGGQPGDTGHLERADGSRIQLGQTRHGASKDIILHMPLDGQPQPFVGERLKLAIDWDRRHRLMRMHTACHLLSVVCPHPITGAAVGEDDSRVDFDMSETIDKDAVTAQLMALFRSGLSPVDHRRGACSQSGHREIEERSPSRRARTRQPGLHRRQLQR